MSLAKRSSRTIEIDGETYRWAVSPDSGTMWLVIEHAHTSGQRVEAGFDYHDSPSSDRTRTHQRRIVTPETVRRIVKYALAAGWQSERRGLRRLRINGDMVVPLERPLAPRPVAPRVHPSQATA